MASANRVGQINGEILRALSELLPNLKDPRVRGLVSIVRTDTASDLSICRVYVSTMGDRKALEKGLRSATGWLRRELGNALALRHVPALEFIADDSIQEGARILGILEQITDDTPS